MYIYIYINMYVYIRLSMYINLYSLQIRYNDVAQHCRPTEWSRKLALRLRSAPPFKGVLGFFLA